MPIPASNPVVTPAVPSVTYNSWWLANIQISCNPTRGAAIATLIHAFQDESGQWQLMPGDRGITINVPDLWPAVAASPTFQNAMTAILAAVEEQGSNQGLL